MADIMMVVDSAVITPVNRLPLIDDTDFKTIKAAVAYNAGGMDLRWNFVTPAGVQTSTAVTPTTAGSYDWTHLGDGIYSMEIPASGGASANNDTEGFGWWSGVCTGVLPWAGPIIQFSPAHIVNGLVTGTDNLQVDTIQVGGTTQTARDIGASVLLSSGTGTGQLSITSGIAKVDVDTIKTQAVTAAAPVTVLASVGTAATSTAQTGDSFARLTGTGAVTFASLTVTGAYTQTGAATYANGIAITNATTNGHGFTATGNGTGYGFRAIGGSDGGGFRAQGGATSGGNGIEAVGGAGHGIAASASATNRSGIVATGTGTGDACGIEATGSNTGHGIIAAASGSGDGIKATSVSGVQIRGNITGNVTGNLSGTIGGLTAAALKDFFDTDSTTTYASAVAGSVVKEIADNAGGGTPPTAAAIADAVWDEALAGHLTAGSTGEALNAAGSAGDPWVTVLPGAYGAGSAGKIIGDNINATISSRSTLAAADIRTAVGLASANLDTQLDTLPTAAEIADAVWDEDATAHQTQGTFGQAIGDPAADTNSIFKAVVTDATGATVGVDVVDLKTQIGTAGAGLTVLATQASVNTIDDFLDTEVAAIKAKTDLIPAAPAAVGDIPTAVQNADALLGRNVSGGSSTGRTVKQALHFIRNKWVVSAGTLTVYDTDDSTSSWTAAVTGTPGADPVTGNDPA